MARETPNAGILARPAAVLLLYTLATLILTYPLSFNLSSRVPLGSGDLWQNLWNFWWWKKALLELHLSPYWSDYLFHPNGLSLAFHTHSPLNVLATLPISLVFGIEAAHNTALLASFALAGLGGYLLVRELCGDPRAAVIAGAFFAFSPTHFEQSLEHLNLASIQFLPIFLFYLLRCLRVGGRRNWVGTGLAFAFNALVCWQYGLLAIPIGGALALRELLPSRRQRALPNVVRDLLFAGALAALLVLPFAWPMIAGALGEAGVPPRIFRNIGTDPLFWLLPSDHHPVLGPLTQTLYAEKRSYPHVGFLSYLGWVPIALALLALCSRRFGSGHRVFWGCWVAVFLVLSLGMHPTIAGQLHKNVLLPHGWFKGVPLLEMLSSANRFVFFAQLGLCVLLGSSLSALFAQGRSALAWGLGALLIFEFLWLPYPTRAAGPHPYFAELANDPNPGAVLHLPFPTSATHAQAMYDQTSHQHPIIGGYASYHEKGTQAAIQSSHFLRKVQSKLPAQNFDRNDFSALGIGTVAVHLDRTQQRYRERAEAAGADHYAKRAFMAGRGYPGALLHSLLARLQTVLGRPIYLDDRLVVFRVPPAG